MSILIEEETLRQAVSSTEMPLSSLRAADDDRQRYAQMLTLIGGDMPLIGIGKVFEHYLGDVQLLTFSL